MRHPKINMRPLVVINYLGTEELRDNNGNLTGDKVVKYSPAKVIMARVSSAKGDADVEVFGTDISYDKVIVMSRRLKESCKITENTVYCIDTKLKYDNDTRTPLYDYHTKRIADDINEVLIAVEKVRSK